MNEPKNKRRPGGGGARETIAVCNNDQTIIPTSRRVQELCRHLHALGPRCTFELIVQLAADYGDGVLVRLGQYERLSPEIAQVLGATRFPPLPIRVVS